MIYLPLTHSQHCYYIYICRSCYVVYPHSLPLFLLTLLNYLTLTLSQQLHSLLLSLLSLMLYLNLVLSLNLLSLCLYFLLCFISLLAFFSIAILSLLLSVLSHLPHLPLALSLYLHFIYPLFLSFPRSFNLLKIYIVEMPAPTPEVQGTPTAQWSRPLLRDCRGSPAAVGSSPGRGKSWSEVLQNITEKNEHYENKRICRSTFVERQTSEASCPGFESFIFCSVQSSSKIFRQLEPSSGPFCSKKCCQKCHI